MNSTPEPILSIELPFNEKLMFYSLSFGGGDAEVAITSGFYGDEHNGMYVCHKLIHFLGEVDRGKTKKWKLNGRVKILPALNPLGTLTDRRFWPFDQRDINLSFPGVPLGETTERIAASVLAALRSCRYCVDLHSGSRFYNELPQVRLYESVQVPMEQAAAFCLPIIWRRVTTPLLSGSLAHNLNERGVPTFIVYFGSANRVSKFFCQWVFAGILKFLCKVGVLEGSGEEMEFVPVGLDHLNQGRTVTPEQEFSLWSKEAGFFVPDARVGDMLETNQPIGRIIDPIGGVDVVVVKSPHAGVLFTLRNNPILYAGTLIARVAG